MHIYRRINITIPLTKETKGKIDNFVTELRDEFKGVTWSVFSESLSPFFGWGLNPERKFELDRVAIIFTDVNPEEIHIENFFKELKQRMEKEFEPQQIWMTMHDITLIE